jgi:hypothetical protein
LFTPRTGKLMQGGTQGPEQPGEQVTHGAKVLEDVQRPPHEPDKKRNSHDEPLDAHGAGKEPADIHRLVARVGQKHRRRDTHSDRSANER